MKDSSGCGDSSSLGVAPEPSALTKSCDITDFFTAAAVPAPKQSQISAYSRTCAVGTTIAVQRGTQAWSDLPHKVGPLRNTARQPYVLASRVSHANLYEASSGNVAHLVDADARWTAADVYLDRRR